MIHVLQKLVVKKSDDHIGGERGGAGGAPTPPTGAETPQFCNSLLQKKSRYSNRAVTLYNSHARIKSQLHLLANKLPENVPEIDLALYSQNLAYP